MLDTIFNIVLNKEYDFNIVSMFALKDLFKCIFM